MAFSAVFFALPQEASAAIPTVKIGGVSISSYNDNKWHAYNAKKPAISGWTAGKYKLSTDGKTLYIDGFKYSGSKRGISSTSTLKVVPSGTNTFTCNGARGICLEDSNDNVKSLTLAGASGSTLNLKCTSAKSIAVNALTVSGGTINATGALSCESSITVSGGKLAVTGNGESGKNLNVSGGTFSTTGELSLYSDLGNFNMTGGTVTVGKVFIIGGAATVSAGTVTANGDIICYGITLSGGSVTSKADIDCYDAEVIGRGGTMTAGGRIYSDKNMTLSGADLSALTGGVDVEGNLTMTGGSLSGTCNSGYSAVYVKGNASVSKGTLTGKNTVNNSGIHVAGSSTVSGTGRIMASTGNCSAFYTSGTLTVSGGSIETVNTAAANNDNTSWSSLTADKLTVTGGTINASNGGSAGNAIMIYKAADISGGSVTAAVTGKSNSWEAFRCSGNITVTGGSLSGTNSGNGQGIYTASSLAVSGTADVSGKADSGYGVYVPETLNVDGGSVSAVSNGAALRASTLKISSGTVNGTGTDNSGIYLDVLDISGGTVTGITTSDSAYYFPVAAEETLRMTGGKLTGKTATSRFCGVIAPIGGTYFADDIWMSTPSDGYTNYFTGSGSVELDERKSDGSLATEVTFQKVSSVSVKTAPAAVLYAGDKLDLTGLALNVTFEDGQTSVLSYRDETKSLFTFDRDLRSPIGAGTFDLGITCLTKKTSCRINVRAIGGTTLSGRAAVHSMSFTWSKADGATKYDVYCKQGDSRFTCIDTVTGRTSYELTGLSPGDTRSLYVRPMRDGTSGYTYAGPNSNVVTLTAALLSPEIRLRDTGFDSLSIEWNAVEGVAAYYIYRSTDDSGYIFIGTVGDPAVTEYTDIWLTTGTEYSYYVKAAIPDIGLLSKESNTVSAVPTFTGTTNLSVTNNGSYELEWRAVEGATGYEILRGDGSGGDKTLIEEVPASDKDTLTYTDSSADCYSVYSYTVRPKREVSGSTFYAADSNTVTGEALVRPEPPKPQPVITPPKTDDPAGTTFNLLQARAGKVTKKSVQIKWKKVAGAKKYIVYGNKCGVKNKYRKLKTTTGTSLNFTKVAGKKVAKGTYYKFIIYAVDSKGRTISTSKTIHTATAGGKVGNDKKVITAAKKNRVTLKKGKTFKLKAKAVPASKKLKVRRHRKMAYETSNKKVAVINSRGVIKAKGRGTCYVYAYTQNGICARVKVVVR